MQRTQRLLLVPLAAIAFGCGDGAKTAASGDTNPTDVLKRSMDRYAAMKSLDAQIRYRLTSGEGEAFSAKRTISYEKPNRFALHLEGPSVKMSCVSDGNTMLEQTTSESRSAAPASISASTAMSMTHPMFMGSVIYRFFEGSGGLAKLADMTKPIEAGPEVTVGDEPCHVIRFYAEPSFGNTTVWISKKDFLVRRIGYDMAPLMKLAKERSSDPSLRQMPQNIEAEELFENIQVDKPIDAKAFALGSPKPEAIRPGERPPDLKVTTMDGKPVSWQSLKGKPVLIDFWATWCGPCVKGLPITEKIATQFKDRLQVLAVSSEPKETIEKFLKEQELSLASYLDPGGQTMIAFEVASIPTLLLVDAEGKVVEKLVGLQPEENLRRALAKVGLK